MLSLTANPPKPFTLSTPFLSPPHPLPTFPNPTTKSSPKPLSISALIIPPSSSYHSEKPVQQNLYQPFRPPPSPVPEKYQKLDANARLEVLMNRQGMWFEYAPLIPMLNKEGFTPEIIEEICGISSAEQNRMVVAAKVRDSLVESEVDDEILAYFDSGGAELLYEIRLLSNQQRAAAVKYTVERKFDVQQTEELARAVKDKPRRKGDKGWRAFDSELPGDCLAFMYFRQAQEHLTASSEEEWKSALKKALEFVESEEGRKAVVEELEGGKENCSKGGEAPASEAVRVPVVRMKVGEAAEASVVMIFPVCRSEEGAAEVEAAPWECRGSGEFGVVETEKAWNRWVVLPGWAPIVPLKRGGVVVAFKSAGFLPWRVNKANRSEAILVVADRDKKEVTEDAGFYLVAADGNGSVGAARLKVERGIVLKELGISQSLASVLLVVRPPRDEDDEINPEEWN